MTDEATATPPAHLAAMWQSFDDMCVPKEAGERQRYDMKMAFYGGALSLLAALGDASELPDDEAEALLTGVRNELAQFSAECLSEDARDKAEAAHE